MRKNLLIEEIPLTGNSTWGGFGSGWGETPVGRRVE